MNFDRPIAPDPYSLLPSVPSFSLISDDVIDGELMDIPFAHSNVGGEDRSPQLAWSGFPKQTRGFVVTCLDPDAPTGSGFWHWSVVNIPASVTELPSTSGGSDRALPQGAFSVRNDYGSRGYGGAAPPAGDRLHRYFFVVHALDVERLDVTTDVPPAAVGYKTVFHTLARATLTPTYRVSG
ncbi:YbhB/YbcL family Raf kinase inhibitor-like protein [Micromonospora sp. KC207]|uniref:YbhB/YbcL family Raf kinase inhibitor-like protein n=1 Tax=Micromonospora sp. KC207 TaxID=2530377 RepID=UPI001046AD92|nr:YbhB/YbcL family Raf kinase inhibitor-like protein [Micromonospora sp. KC207]TDC59464.1 YbhB/YbcL family Raf kinase inhibitor-like protein [Micromonospora sp. KC207]